MSPSGETPRLHALTSRLCDGELTPQERDELATLLNGNAESIGDYLDQTSLHLAISERLRQTLPDDTAAPNEVTAEHSSTSGERRPIARRPLNQTRFNLRSLVAVAASLLVVGAFLLYWQPWSSPPAVRIAEAIDCDWGEQHWGTPKSADLEPGQEIKLETGLMVLDFGDGAEVTLEAPVHFTVLAKDRGRLIFGKLTARVPEKAHGFTVELPLANIVDLGTQFGAKVAENGTCEAHVFEGTVLVQGTRDSRPTREWKLAAGSALQLGAKADEIKQFAADLRLFVRRSAFVNPVAAHDNATVHIPGDSNLALWLDAGKRLQLDDAGRVVGWSNSNSLETDSERIAWQVKSKLRPLWISSAFGKRPAVRFDGRSYLTTTPFESSDDVTVICVFQNPITPVRTSGQIVNFNGPPTLILDHAPNRELVGKLEASWGDQSEALDIALKSPLPKNDEPIVAAYSYGRTMNRSSMYINAVPVAESQAPYPAAVRSSKFIGASNSRSDFFVGDLCEILLFDSCLSADQCVQVSSDLMRKHGIVKSEKEPRILAPPVRTIQQE